MNIPSEKFLEAEGFQLKSFPDGDFWVRQYPNDYTLQADASLTHFTEDDEGWVETDLDWRDFTRLIELQKTHFCE